MIHAYDKSYLCDAQENLAVMMDYAVNGLSVELSVFYPRFLSSGAANAFAGGHPRYLAGMSGIELACRVLAETGDPVPLQDYSLFDRSPEYWTGWALAYLQWYFGMDFKGLAARGVDARWLILHYSPLHEADLTKCAELAGELLARERKCSLKRIRKAAGYTQEGLSESSGVSLRMIRAYEQNAQSLTHAEYRTLRLLSQALGCRPEDLGE